MSTAPVKKFAEPTKRALRIIIYRLKKKCAPGQLDRIISLPSFRCARSFNDIFILGRVRVSTIILNCLGKHLLTIYILFFLLYNKVHLIHKSKNLLLKQRNHHQLI